MPWASHDLSFVLPNKRLLFEPTQWAKAAALPMFGSSVEASLPEDGATMIASLALCAAGVSNFSD